MTSFKKCRAEYKQCLKNAQQDYFLEFLEPKLDQNGKYLYSHIKRLKRDVVGIDALQVNGEMTTDPKEKAEALATQYESVFVKDDSTNMPNILPSPYPDMPEFTINEAGVLKQLEELNVHKSVGPDGLSPHLLKMLGPIITPKLTKIFNQSLSLGKSPQDWKKQYISPIIKPGKDNTLPSSYRPVALTSICCKVLEHVIYSQSMDHLDNYKILSKLQHGYRQGCSTETQLLKVID